MKNMNKDIAPRSKKIGDLVGSSQADFIDLIEKCLTFDPQKRIKPHLALKHPWIINDLPNEIKQIYLKEIDELQKEIEKFIKTEPENIIIIEDSAKNKNVNNVKSYSLEKKQEIYKNTRVEYKLKENTSKNKINKNESESLEKIEIKINDVYAPKPNQFTNFRNLRKVKYSKKKSITFHQIEETKMTLI